MTELTINNAYNLFHEGILAFADMERQGIRVDLDYINNKKKELEEKIDRKEKELKATNFYKHWKHRTKKEPNINSDPQLSHYLYNVLKKTPQKKTATGKGSTDEEALKELNIPELNKILEIRKLKKIKDTYLHGFENESVNSYIHPFFNLHTARTYRSSSNAPNFQNIPARDEEAMNTCRRALFPRPGHQLLEVDYSSIEVCISACYHKDPTMIKYIKDPKSDMHGDMAQQIFFLKQMDKSKSTLNTLRKGAKNGFVFPEFYGDYYGNNAINLCKWGELPRKGKWKGTEGLIMPDQTPLSAHMKQNGITSLNKFKDYLQEIEIDFWDNRFPGYKKWKKDWFKKYQKQGFIELLTGFRCRGVLSFNDATNYPIQGSAFHCLLWSLIELNKLIKKEGLKTRLINQVHDSLLLDVYPPELDYILELVRWVTCTALPNFWKWIIVPLDIEAELSPVDHSWAEKEQIKI